jgi:hypothetical protein
MPSDGRMDWDTQQDMRCGKCMRVRSDVSRYWHCSGPYQLVLSNLESRRRLGTAIVNVAIVRNPSRLGVSYLVLSNTYIIIVTS